MKKALKIVFYPVLVIVILVLIAVMTFNLKNNISRKRTLKQCQPEMAGDVQTISINGYTFRDLNKNGKLDIYEDAREGIENRVNDLIGQMTLEEKAGSMFFAMVAIKQDGSISEGPSLSDPFSLLMDGTSEMMFLKKINHMNILTGTSNREMALWYNNLQKLAEKTRLGIPVTIASDPRNHFTDNPLSSALSGGFSQFPEPLGLAATGDSMLVAEFANIARQEYLAAGIRVALHPQIDLSTEPRWSRINGTFGEDAVLTSKLGSAYILGFQGDSLGSESVACMTKHFSGGGPQKEGIDPHMQVQKGQIYPGNNFNYHLLPFEAAFKVKTASIMPYYGVPMGMTSEDVGFSFNKELITGLLREHYHFDGVVCTDWGIINDWKLFGKVIMPARAWGMVDKTEEERMVKVIDAGIDQFGGEMQTAKLVKLVEEGKISERRIDESVRRLMRQKFILGLFDQPFVDMEKSVATIGKPEFMAAGELAQRKSLVLLKIEMLDKKPALPLSRNIKIYVENINPEVASEYGTVVKSPKKADFAIIRIKPPSTAIKGGGLLGMMLPGGDLNYSDNELEDIMEVVNAVPTIVDIYLNRPAVIPEIAAASKGLVANFGANDRALLDVVFGEFNPQGKLPIEMPSSMEAVRNQKEDMPYDSKDPLFPFGFGLSYN